MAQSGQAILPSSMLAWQWAILPKIITVDKADNKVDNNVNKFYCSTFWDVLVVSKCHGCQ
jgi:hypothetical protein